MNATAFVAAVWAASLQAAIVLAAAALLVRVGRRWPPALRLRLLQGSLACALVAPLASAALPAATVAAKDPVAVDPAPFALVTAADPSRLLIEYPGGAALVLAVLAAGMVIRFMRLAAGQYRLRHGVRESAAPDVVAEVAAQQRALGTHADVVWRADVRTPSTFGRYPARVMLPVSLASADPPTRQAIVCHELLHVRRGDWSALVMEELLRTLCWFHPGIHWATAEMRLAREQLVDREVVAITGARRSYLELLFSYAEIRPAATGAAVPFFGRRQLERRIRHLTEETTMRNGRTAAVLAGVLVLGGSAAAAVRLAPVTPIADTLQQLTQEQDAKADTEEKTLPRVIHEVAAIYPAEAMQARVEGTVVVEVTVEADGTVSATRVVESVPMLDDAATEALRQWRFDPGRVRGKPVRVDISIQVRFRLK